MTTKAVQSNTSGWVDHPEVLDQITDITGVTAFNMPIVSSSKIISHDPVDALYVVCRNDNAIISTFSDANGVITVPANIHIGKGLLCFHAGNVVEWQHNNGNLIIPLKSTQVTISACNTIITDVQRITSSRTIFDQGKPGYTYTLVGVIPPYMHMSPLHVVDISGGISLLQVPGNDPKRNIIHRLDVVEQCNYITVNDPAIYGYTNTNELNTYQWHSSHVGEVWLNMSNVAHTPYEFEPCYPSIEDRLQAWASTAYWSNHIACEWVVSRTLPIDWDGEGTPALRLEYDDGDGNIEVFPYVSAHTVDQTNLIPTQDGMKWCIHHSKLGVYAHGTLVEYSVNGILNGTSVIIRPSTVSSVEQINALEAESWFIPESSFNGYVANKVYIKHSTGSTLVMNSYVGPFIRIPETAPTFDNVSSVKLVIRNVEDGEVIVNPHKGTFAVYTPYCEYSGEQYSTYGYWITSTQKTDTIQQVMMDRSSPYFFIVDHVQEYDIVTYKKLIVRNVRQVVSDNGRYGLVMHKDYTTSQMPASMKDYRIDIKPIHREYVTQRNHQSEHVLPDLWAWLVDTAAGVLPSGRYLLSTCYGYGDGMAMGDAKGILNTILTTCVILERDKLYHWNINYEELLERYDVNTPLDVIDMLTMIYRTQTSSAVNTIFFNCLKYGLTLRKEYTGVMKTSMLALRGSRKLDVNNGKNK